MILAIIYSRTFGELKLNFRNSIGSLYDLKMALLSKFNRSFKLAPGARNNLLIECIIFILLRIKRFPSFSKLDFIQWNISTDGRRNIIVKLRNLEEEGRTFELWYLYPGRPRESYGQFIIIECYSKCACVVRLRWEY